MQLEKFYKSVLESDSSQIVICDLEHTIVYMNAAARARYQNSNVRVGASILDCHNADSNEKIRRVVDWFAADKSHNKVYTFCNDKEQKDVYMIALRDEQGELIGYYEKHEYRTNETMKMYDLK